MSLSLVNMDSVQTELMNVMYTGSVSFKCSLCACCTVPSGVLFSMLGAWQAVYTALNTIADNN